VFYHRNLPGIENVTAKKGSSGLGKGANTVSEDFSQLMNISFGGKKDVYKVP